VKARANDGTIVKYTSTDNMPGNGNNFYRIKVVEKSGEINYSAVVKVNITATTSALNVYPNPVTGRVIDFTLNNAKQGVYHVAITNTSGQTVHNDAITINGNALKQQITLLKKPTPGLYTLQLENGDTMFKTSILVQ
jgi:hypothetical protein